MLSLCLTISITEKPFSAMAPVGQACTHLPQLARELPPA